MITGYLSVDKTLGEFLKSRLTLQLPVEFSINSQMHDKSLRLRVTFQGLYFSSKAFLKTSSLTHRKQCIFKAEQFIMQPKSGKNTSVFTLHL